MNYLRFNLLLGLLVLLCSCKPSGPSSGPSYPPPTKTIDSGQVTLLMLANGINVSSFALPDSKYLLPTLRWVQDDFSSGLRQFQHELRISTWTSESNDCDKFAIAASFYAKWLNHCSPNRDTSAALAFGELYYLKSGLVGQGHAINFFVVQSGENLQLVFYEPQIQSVVRLTSAEVRSVFFWKL